MKKKALSLALALMLCLGLLPTAAFAAETDLPDWYFLFAIFKNVDADGIDKNGEKQHAKYTMTQDEINYIKETAAPCFEEYMTTVGVMRAHVDVIEIDEPITELHEHSTGSYASQEDASPLLQSKVDLDQYDHVFVVVSLNDFATGYAGVTGSPFKNGTGCSCINLKNRENALDWQNDPRFPPNLYVHEFIHFMERMSLRWGVEFQLHLIQEKFYQNDPDWSVCLTDVLLNRVKGDAETGTGVYPLAWQYQPRVVRTMTELNIPTGVTAIGQQAFQYRPNLTKVTIPDSVTIIGDASFGDCTGLTEVNLPSSVTIIDQWAFAACSALTKVIIPASVTSIGHHAFYETNLQDVYYGGTEAQWKAIQIDTYNEPLTKATIHYNSPAPSTQPTTPSYQVSDWAKDRVALAVSTGLAATTLGNDYRVNITRAQFAATAVKLYEAMSGKTIAPVIENPFTDTTDPVILQAASMGFVSGVGNGKFSPDALVTREQAAVMLSSVYTKLGGTLPAVTATTFADDGQVAAWSRNAVAFMSDKGIVSGVGENRFSPQGQASIEQALLIALKMFEDLK